MEGTLELFVMVGIPGSGKTTWAKDTMEEFRKANINASYISRDDVRRSMLQDGDEYFAREDDVYDEFIRLINESIARGTQVTIADATHLSPKTRKMLLDRLNLETVSYIYFKVLDTPLEVALERNEHREGFSHVPPAAIKNMYNRFIKPTVSEFDYLGSKYIGIDTYGLE